MKRATIIFLSLCMLFSLFTCAAASAEDTAQPAQEAAAEPVQEAAAEPVQEAAAPALRITDYATVSLDQAIRDAESGNTDAMAYLGNLYYLGNYKLGITRDFSKALEWFLKAAPAGDNKVLFNIARIYERGSVGEMDLETAYEWYTKAAAAGNADAQTSIDSDAYKTIRWKANSTELKGCLAEQEMVGTGFAMPFYLEAPVVDCDKIAMDLRIVEVKNGWPYGRYALWALNMDEKWTEVTRFQIEKFQEDGEPRNYEFELEEPISFKALAVCLSESGMEFGLVHDDVFYVDSACVSSYSDTMTEPVFTPSAEEYPTISARVSYSAYSNPYPVN